jgi:UDP-GlcNAc:undecaprenyl-phosphate/decaprenyl-phosphate GlcNAc-1-phosphate transferase
VNQTALYFLTLLAAALATAAALPFWRRWCRRHGAVDDPGHRKIHAASIPLAGGPAVMTGLLAALLGGTVFAFLHSSSGTMGLFQYGLGRRAIQLLGITVGAAGMLLIGLRDDKVELQPAAKFGGQLLAALAVAATGVRITLFVHNIVFSYGMTALWILTVVNAFNFMDNMNGLCAGLGAIGAGWFGLIAAQAGPPQYLVATMAFLIAGALLGFLPYNFPNASAFLGDSGSHLVGYLLAVLGILPHFYTPRHPRTLAVLAPLLILAVPLADLAWVVLLRWRMGQPFYLGDTNHLSHRLVRRGLSAMQAVLVIWLLAAALGALAFFLWK